MQIEFDPRTKRATVCCDTCDECYAVHVNVKDLAAFNRMDHNWIKRRAVALGWNVKGDKVECRACQKARKNQGKETEEVRDMVEQEMEQKPQQRLIDGITAEGIDTLLRGEPVHLELLVSELGAKEAARRLGISTSSVLNMISYGCTGNAGRVHTGDHRNRNIGIKLVYEMAAKGALADIWGEKDAKIKDKLGAAEERIRVLSEENENLREIARTPVHERAEQVDDLRDAIIGYFDGKGVFDLTPDDMALLDKTVRQIAKGD